MFSSNGTTRLTFLTPPGICGFVIAAVWFAAVWTTVGSATEPCSRTDDIGEFLPEELVGIAPPDLPPDQNAREILLAMVARVRPPTDARQKRFLSEFASGTAEMPSEEDRGWLRNLVDRNRSAMELFEDVLEHSHVRLVPEEDRHSLERGVSELDEIRRARIRLLIESGDFSSAVDETRRSLRFGELLTAPPADHAMFSIGLRSQVRAVALLEQSARERDIPSEVLKAFVDLAFSAGADPEAVSFVLQKHFDAEVKPQLQRLPPDRDATAVIDCWLDRVRPGNPLPFENFDLDAELRKRQQQVETLLAGHPHPYDREKTIRIVVDRFARAVQGPDKWDPAVRNQQDCWPEELSLHLLDLVSLLLGREQPVLDSAQLQAAAECLREVENPLGRHLAAEMSFLVANRVFVGPTSSIRIRATALAVRLFHDTQGRLPGSLEEVVQAGILPDIPSDPFGDKLHYNAERKIVWSVGVNGVNENGTFGPGPGFALLRKLKPAGVPDYPEPSAKSSADDRVVEIPLPGTREVP